MQARTKKVLEMFVERAGLLGSSTYLTSAKTASCNLMPAEFRGPNREQLDAFVVRLRFFIQNNEPTSLDNVSKLLQGDSTLSTKLIQEFETVRTDLNKAFDALPPIKVTSNNYPTPPTWGEIWDVFIYGEVAHSNQAKRDRYNHWKNHEPTHVLFSYYLSRILSVMASGIVFVADLFEAELKGGAPPANDANAP